MVYYFSSPAYQPMIDKVLSETSQMCVGKQTGEEIFIKKYIRENITSFENVDVLLIDLTALADTDEEIMQGIESLRIMDYDIRFVIMAPHRREGDAFLKSCFYAGIYDLIVTDEYLKMYEQLTLCLTQKMRYKDALHFRDAVEEAPQETLAVQKILVGIAGAGQRMGCTHNSIVLANFLRENNQMVAVMEMNSSNAFMKFCNAQNAKYFEEGYFSLKGSDYYPECDKKRLTAVSGKLYNFIILDFGNYDEADRVSFNKCDVRIIFSGTKPWETDNLETIFRDQEETVLKKYHFCFPGTTNSNLQKKIIKHMEPLENVWFPEYTEDPFESSSFPEGKEIFSGYLHASKVTEKKKLFRLKKQ